MVKGVSRQVILVRSPDPKLFEQAIFILTEEAILHGYTDEMLLKEAQKAANNKEKGRTFFSGPLWACAGAVVTGVVWLITVLF